MDALHLKALSFLLMCSGASERASGRVSAAQRASKKLQRSARSKRTVRSNRVSGGSEWHKTLCVNVTLFQVFLPIVEWNGKNRPIIDGDEDALYRVRGVRV